MSILRSLDHVFSVIRLFKIDKAKRRQYWTFDVGRSMFDVQLSLEHVFSVIQCSMPLKVHMTCQEEPNFKSTLSEKV